MHKALYRAYRPQRFEDVVGQQHIVQTLKNQIQYNNIGHAYLFCGTRGTGKTSTAKIFARSVNCNNSIGQEPCNECEICREILNDNIMDVIEIDAASNNSVDDIREIRENVRYSPAKCRYKVYIIDEVHMLSQGAFNALLKTLEEPPAYIIFILATTEPHKIPATILSRCQRFEFKRVTASDIANRMITICNDMNIEVEEKALNLIARNAQGALRDALSILDQSMSLSEEKILYEDVVDLLGTVNIDHLFMMSNAMLKEDTKTCLEILNEFIMLGKDIKTFIGDLIDHFRNLMVCKISNELEDIISLPSESIQDLKNQAQGIQVNDVIRILNILSETQDEIKYSSNARVLAEVSMMKLCQPMYDESKESLIKRIAKLEGIIQNGVVVDKGIKTTLEEETSKQIVNKPKEQKYEKIKNADVTEVEKGWRSILYQIKKDKQMPIYALLSEVKNFNVSNDILYIIFENNFAFAKNKLSAPDTVKYIENTIRSVLDRSFGIKIVLKSESSNIELEINKNEIDKGEEFLSNIFPNEIIEIKDSIKEN